LGGIADKGIDLLRTSWAVCGLVSRDVSGDEAAFEPREEGGKAETGAAGQPRHKEARVAAREPAQVLAATGSRFLIG